MIINLRINQTVHDTKLRNSKIYVLDDSIIN